MRTREPASARALADRDHYHPDNPADYPSPIGMVYECGGRTYFVCVGCWWCCPAPEDFEP